MIRIKIDKNKKEQPIFKIYIKDIEGYKFLKRSLIEGKKISGKYNYEIPLRFFVPIFNNINKNEINLDSNSKLEFLEFWDEFEEKYYSTLEATPKFMKLWREEGCPDIFKVKINRETLELKKEVVFKKINPFK
ncbi:hypothetical protein [Clostridium septicum]|uniref:Uncharacterized protein n=1 Tax=Clostridium septicum TaxID=1504 RepID=A0A9N7JIS6_CLOSE|nr:hypothetical protein [Clostridium septicum]AYE33040.1 hypothetical protein CP523_00530 [Clostridium septicum]MDU1313436.1 hypothetical protein [Clostridium septicum]QAS61209.1 hypothetical protein EI377_11020 [Clostridium septicum]UEC19441.1 hypothetical protein LK444_08365 [Clostridium septicum]USR99606.1 hypothetical protein NH397_08820 [Clostridium septicum]